MERMGREGRIGRERRMGRGISGRMGAYGEIYQVRVGCLP